MKAVEQGDWLLLDNVNFCNANVLDRLNSLFEPNGKLLINECGLKDGKARIISPHKNFKAFLIMNPLHGEISRAMRNRCIEICFTGSATTDDLLDASRGKGIHNLSTAVQLKHVHDTIDTSTTIPALRPSPRDFTTFSNLVSSQISHGSTLDEAMQRGIQQIYTAQQFEWDKFNESLYSQYAHADTYPWDISWLLT